MNDEFIFSAQETDDSGGVINVYSGEEKAGELTYVKAGADILIIDSTSVHSAFKGKNLGRLLVGEIVKLAIAENKQLIPLCPFAKKVFEDTPEYAGVWRK